MSALIWIRRLAPLLLLAAAFQRPALAQDAAPQTMIDALTLAHSAVVGIQVSATEGARSAQSLGQQRSGSGVLISEDGLILTIGYLLLEAETIEVITQDRKHLPARAVGYDLATGFGLLRPLTSLGTMRPAPLGSAATVQPGDALMASMGGEDSDVASTRLVSKRAFSGFWEYHLDTALFTSPPIDNHSGAPLFNQRGELLGIGSLFVTNSLGGNARLPGNMFVPVDLLKPILGEMQQTGSTRFSHRPWLGLSSSEQDGRVQVVRVTPDSPAQTAGLKPGDVVLAIDGVKVARLETFYKKLWEHGRPDAEITLTVLQGADINTITLKAADRMSTMLKPAGI